ncbi:VWA domain-containing protein [Candidatus Poribacteria bacterium]|nr:VWA domain-containing protein [Candidatus Poribacteria bacterium]
MHLRKQIKQPLAPIPLTKGGQGGCGKGDGIAFLISIIVHCVFLIILAIFLHKQKVEQISNFVELELVTVENPEPKRRFRRMSEVVPLNDMVKINHISKELEFKPKLVTPKVNVQVAMLNMPESSLPSTAAEGLQGISSDILARPASSSASLGKRSMSAKVISRPPVTVRPINIVKPERKTGMDNALLTIAEHIADMNKTGKEDLVFVIDASGSMEKYIIAVANYLARMANVLVETGIDYTFGILTFNRIGRNNQLEIFEQTKDLEQCKRILRAIKCDGDERALDAIAEGLSKIKFRPDANRTFVLVTNEKLTGDHSAEEIIRQSKESGTKVNVIGIDDPKHKELAEQTGGLWFQAPE